MAKKGGSRHTKRLCTPKLVPLRNKKSQRWLLTAAPGPHPKGGCMTLAVMLRDVMAKAQSMREAKGMIKGRQVYVDGRLRKAQDFPVGLMDVLHFPAEKSHYRMEIKKGRFSLVPIAEKEAAVKFGRVVRKYSAKRGKLMATLHDGKNVEADDHVRVGDTVIVSLPDAKIKKTLTLEPGCRCLIMSGKHAGIVGTLEEIKTQVNMPDQAKLKSDKGELITVKDYLFVVDETYGKSG